MYFGSEFLRETFSSRSLSSGCPKIRFVDLRRMNPSHPPVPPKRRQTVSGVVRDITKCIVRRGGRVSGKTPNIGRTVYTEVKSWTVFYCRSSRGSRPTAFMRRLRYPLDPRLHPYPSSHSPPTQSRYSNSRTLFFRSSFLLPFPSYTPCLQCTSRPFVFSV